MNGQHKPVSIAQDTFHPLLINSSQQHQSPESDGDDRACCSNNKDETAPKAGEQLDKYRPSSPPPSLERVIVVDTETTGFGKMDRIVQIAWAVHDTASQVKVDSACFTVHPGLTPFIVPRRVATIHGITNDVAQDTGVDLIKVLDAFEATITSHAVTTLVAHNLPFDLRMILAECDRMGKECLAGRLRSMHHACTLQMARTRKNLKRKLGELYGDLFNGGVTPAKCHQADADVEYCARLYFYFVKGA